MVWVYNPDDDWNLWKIYLKDKKEKNIQPHVLGVRTFIRATKKNVAFAIYATPMGSSTEKDVLEIPMQYLDFKDVFEKKNANILPEHCLYDCAIELKDGAQLPFGPIYNLSQTG
jgi:hypothetical protein